MPRAAITCVHLQRHFSTFRAEFDALGVEAVLPAVPGQHLDSRAMQAALAGCTAAVVGDDVVDRAVVEAAKNGGLRAIIKWGVGTDNIDKAAAHALGIPVYNTPGVFGEEVADAALGYLLLLARGLHRMHQSVREGGWLKVEGRSLAGMTAGIVGLGSVGRAIARRARAFGMTAIGSDVVALDREALRAEGLEQVSFEALIAGSDAVFIACNLTADNRHLFNRGVFERMKPEGYLINVSRGALVDEKALAAALGAGRLAGAGLDVFEEEPLPANSPLRRCETCVLGTHNASNTREAVTRVNRMSVDILFHVLGLRIAPRFEPHRVA
jgi:D-3-phosphoglycerate dehydrogenase